MLINGRTPEDVKKAIHVCWGITDETCETCPYRENGWDCESTLADDTLALIEYYERRIEKQNALLALMGITIPEEAER